MKETNNQTLLLLACFLIGFVITIHILNKENPETGDYKIVSWTDISSSNFEGLKSERRAFSLRVYDGKCWTNGGIAHQDLMKGY